MEIEFVADIIVIDTRGNGCGKYFIFYLLVQKARGIVPLDELIEPVAEDTFFVLFMVCINQRRRDDDVIDLLRSQFDHPNEAFAVLGKVEDQVLLEEIDLL